MVGQTDPRQGDGRISLRLPVRTWPERRVVVLSVATLLLIGAFTASVLSEAALDELAVLYTMPVILSGLELGASGGAVGAGVAFLLLLVASDRHSELEPFGLVACGTVFLLAGALAGHFSTRMRAAQLRQQRLLDSGLRLARIKTLESLPRLLAGELQGMLEVSCVRVQLDGAAAVEIGEPAGQRLLVPVEARGISFGTLTLFAPEGGSFAPDDRVVAGQLALQVAVAVDNQRLLEAERERAALHVELEQTRERLASHLRDVGQILDGEEAERRRVAHRLHEGAAQDMAALLLELQVLAEDLDRELSRNQLEEVRRIARGTLADLRQLAINLRPPSLDEHGLRAALEGMVERVRNTDQRELTLEYECPGELSSEAETAAYRLVDDAIRNSTGSLAVQLKLAGEGDTLLITVRAEGTRRDRELVDRLARARARIVLTGGTLRSSFNGATTIVAELPAQLAADGRRRQ